jgi:phosphatidylserine decarboxylase
MHFRIHNEGWVYLIVSVILTIISFPFFPIIGLFLLIISFCLFYFFRDPIRIIPNENVIVSPADGKIVFIGESNLPEECDIKEEFHKISIFLDIFNVHVNRMPMSGTVKDIKYIPGKFFRANVEKSSKENERNIITIENIKKEKIIVTQIAGLIARRIVCDLKINQEVLKGERFGIIKFGSRVDLYLPKNYNLMVNVGQTVIGGETIISNPDHIINIRQSNKI